MDFGKTVTFSIPRTYVSWPNTYNIIIKVPQQERKRLVRLRRKERKAGRYCQYCNKVYIDKRFHALGTKDTYSEFPLINGLFGLEHYILF